MNYKELIDIIKKKELENIYLFKGDEEFFFNKVIELIKDKYILEDFIDFNYIRIKKGSSFQDIINACETLPIMSERKLIVIEDLIELGEEDSSFLNKLEGYLFEVHKSNILILLDRKNKLRRNTKLYKTIDKNYKLVNFNRLNKNELINWIEKEIRKRNKSIKKTDLLYFIDLTRYLDYRSEKTMYEVENELNKVINYSKGKFITREDIESNYIKQLETNIFVLLDQISKKETSLALSTFNEMYLSREPIARILYMIIRQYRNFLQYLHLKSRGYSREKIRKKIGISSYEFKKVENFTRNYSERELIRNYSLLLDVDKKQKTSSIDEKLIMEMLIVELSV